MPKGNIPSDLKIQNRQLIYHFIRNHEPVSKQDIVVGLGLSLPTITQNLQFLERHNLIAATKEKKSTGGRNATAYSYRRDGKFAIGVYITGNHLNAVCVDLSGSVIRAKRERIKFNLNDEAYLKKIGDLVEEIKQGARVCDESLLGVGIAVPSLVSDDGEQVIYGLTHNFSGKTRAEITKYIPYHNRMFHDSYVAGFAEVWIHSDIQNAVYINLNNSIGGSIIIRNHIYSGDTNRSGEIGHITVVPQGSKTCYCGNTGCFDTVCNAGILDSYTDGNLARFFELLDEGDEGARNIWSEYLEHLAFAVHNIRMLFDCSIILGGYVGAYIGKYTEELFEKIDKRNCFGDAAKDYVMPCKYKIEATAAGAAIQLIDDYIRNI
ncbi:MAG: ROK family protein [Blautia sp.]|jgi:predicted NBD/HSP70 family sugar kinase